MRIDFFKKINNCILSEFEHIFFQKKCDLISFFKTTLDKVFSNYTDFLSEINSTEMSVAGNSRKTYFCISINLFQSFFYRLILKN